MDFGALPPEINSARMYTGPGSGPMLAAATAWGGLAAELGSTAAAYQSAISDLTGDWLGPTSLAMSSAAAPYVAWMKATAAQAEQATTQAKDAASAYEAAFAMTVPPPVIAANRAQLAALVATNLLGQNTSAIAATEAHYTEMWAQDAAAMYGYAGSSAAATTLAPFTPPKQNTNQGGLGGQSAAVMQAGSSRTQTTIPQLLQGLSQPLQSVTSSSGLGQMAMGTGTAAATSMASGPASALPGLTAASSKGALKSAGLGAAVLPGLAFGSNAGATGLAMDTLGLGADTVGLAGLETPGLGTELLGLGIEFQGLDIEYAGLAIEQFGAGLAGPLGVAAGGLGQLGGLGVVDVVGASAGMGQAVSLGSLSVPAGWSMVAPAAMRQIALVSAESSAAAAASAAAAGESDVPYAEMALASTAGRAIASAASRARRNRTGATARNRAAPQRSSVNGGVIGIAAELRELAELRDRGILTEEEFAQQKQRLLGGEAPGEAQRP